MLTEMAVKEMTKTLGVRDPLRDSPRDSPRDPPRDPPRDLGRDFTRGLGPPADDLVDRPRLAPVERRNEWIDVVRFFAAGGVVFVHCAEAPVFEYWGNLFRFAVPFYLFASLYFQSRSLRAKPDRPLGSYITKRIHRLYLPFLAWSLIYLVARDLKRATILGMGWVPLSTQLLWKGTEYHLWFLPFLLAFSIVLACTHYALLRRWPRLRWPLIAIAIAAGCVVGLAHMPASWDETFDNPTYAYVQWYRSGPSIFWALAFAWFMTCGRSVLSVSPALGLAGLGLTLVVLFQQALQGLNVISRGLSGLGLILASLAPWRRSAFALLAKLGRYGYGVYLSHVLIVEIFHVATSRLNLPPSATLDVVNFAVSFAGSLLFAHLLSRSPRTAWLNG